MYSIRITNIDLESAKAIIQAFPDLAIETEEFFEFIKFNVFSNHITLGTIIKILHYIHENWDRNDFYEIIIK